MSNTSQKNCGTPNYLTKILHGVVAGEFQAQKGVNHIIVKHDRWCRIYRKKSCNCNPNITICKDGEWLPCTPPDPLK
ncbi:MAG: hypothetical protein P4M13_06205 [Alphaproteobacteria bacterium]|nr:hypothetical protein [Alphaproteobacteria bacterium]